MSDNGLKAMYAVVGLLKTLAICASAIVVSWLLSDAIREVGQEVKSAKDEITAIKTQLQNPFGAR